ncbi:hypothetical protein AB4Z48_18250 [Cupriavidus sp. 2TAF22]|uniref:hypothetical protein n=1 Tax=unclassified Cupriavidus TaxID=2640874 RepID=UPI003F8FC03A
MNLRDDSRVIIGCLLGGLFGGIAIATAWKFTFKPEKDAWDILTALGTIGAVFTALAISLLDGKRRRRAAADQANLVAARASVSISVAIREISFATALLDFYDDPKDKYSNTYDVIKEHIQLAHIDLTHSDLAALVALPNRCAHRIARAGALLRYVERDMGRNAWLFDRSAHALAQSPSGRVDRIEHWANAAHDAGNLLAVANRECEAASELSAPMPDGQEVWGDLD